MNNENTQDDPLQLFNKVIESNQENILTNQATLIAINNFEKLAEREESNRTKFLEALPGKVEVHFAKEEVDSIIAMEKQLRYTKYDRIAIFGTVATAAVVMLISVYFATNWYSTSIKAKSELRKEILDEIKNDGKEIYKIEEVKQLQHNTEIMNKWMQKNPKDAEKFLRFKDGYESR